MSTTKQATAGTTIMTMPGDREIRTERIFNAPRERVWRAMTDPALVAQWWGRGNKLVVERLEVERGGHWRFVEHSDHGAHGFEGRFREVVPLERMSQTFEWDGMPGYPAVQTLTLEDLGDGRTRATYGLSADPGRMLGMLLRGPAEGKVRDFLLGGAAEGLKERAESS